MFTGRFGQEVTTLVEIPDANKKFQKELNSGTAALVLLGLLGQAKEPMYGYQIAKVMEAADDTIPIMKQGALYPVLRSLEASGFLASHVDPSVSGPPRRYYKITDSGRSALETWIHLWARTKSFVDTIIKGRANE
jgi:PadR family transcriptional regulator PadR